MVTWRGAAVTQCCSWNTGTRSLWEAAAAVSPAEEGAVALGFLEQDPVICFD